MFDKGEIEVINTSPFSILRDQPSQNYEELFDFIHTGTGVRMSRKDEDLLILCLEDDKKLNLKWRKNGTPVPNDFGESGGRWSQMFADELHPLLLDTGLLAIPGQDSREMTHDERLSKIDAVLSFLSDNTWFLMQSESSMHAMSNIFSDADYLLRIAYRIEAKLLESLDQTTTETLSTQSRFHKYWLPLFGSTGPIVTCDEYDRSIFSKICSRCRVRLDNCPSMFRLRAEVQEWINMDRDKRFPMIGTVTYDDADMIIGAIRGSGRVCTKPNLEIVAEDFVQTGFIKSDEYERKRIGYTTQREIKFITGDLVLSLRGGFRDFMDQKVRNDRWERRRLLLLLIESCQVLSIDSSIEAGFTNTGRYDADRLEQLRSFIEGFLNVGYNRVSYVPLCIFLGALLIPGVSRTISSYL
jgi:hypothetical protein